MLHTWVRRRTGSLEKFSGCWQFSNIVRRRTGSLESMPDPVSPVFKLAHGLPSGLS